MEVAAGSLIGRATELRALAEAIEGEGSVAVTGEAGIGKTSIVRTAAALLGRVLREGGGFATLDWLPYLPLRRAAGGPIGGDAASAAAQLERAIGPDLLFIDDLQWADEETLAALELVLGRLQLVATIRDGDPGTERARALVRRGGLATIALGALDDEAATGVVRRARPDAPEREVRRIVAEAGGNPLLLEEIAVGGAASTALERALTSRVAGLSVAARASVERLAVAGRPVPPGAAGDGILEAIEAGVAVAHDHEVQIRHALVAEAVLAGLDDAARRRAHAGLARHVPEPLQRARHLAEAGDRAAAGAVALAALDSARDPRDGAALLLLAAEAAADADGPALRLRAARALDEVAAWPAVRRALEWPAAAADGAGPDARLERDAILAHAAYATGDPDGARALLEHARTDEAAASDPGVRARIAIERATFLVNVEGRVAEAIAALDGAGSVASGDVEVLRTSIRLLSGQGGDAAIVAAGLEAAFAAGRLRTATDRARVLQYLLLMGAGAAEALAFLLAQRARFEAAGVGGVALEFLADAAVAAVLAGRLEEAASLADEVLERPAPLRPRLTALTSGARARTLLGRFDEAAGALAGAAAIAPPDYFGRGELLAAQAGLAFRSGRPAAAADLGAAALAVAAPVPVAHVEPALTRAWALVELGRDPGPDPAAGAPSVAGAIPELEGLRAWRADDPARAAAAFEDSAARWAGFSAPHALHARWAAAESRRRAGDTEAAVGSLAKVLEAASAIGFEPLAARVRRSLRLAGVRAPGTIRGQLATAGGLTARERELVELVARGLTNLEIARRLGLGRPTVARILASAMGKLGVASRAQLAAAVET